MGEKVTNAKAFLVSFIPRYIHNRAFLTIYQILTLVPVPRKVREKNYDRNLEQLRNTAWDFWTVPSVYIENQNEWGDILFGTGGHHNMRYSGCEILAVFNALKALSQIGSPESMAELICEFETRGAALRGEFGVSPRAIEAYFRKHGFRVAATDKSDSESLDTVDGQSQVLIATVYNDANDITKQVHTVCITQDAGKGYVLHNTYRKDTKGRYLASPAYATITDALNKISKFGTKLIYLIGISAANFEQEDC